MTNVMAALPNIGGAVCSTPQSLADAHCWSTVQYVNVNVNAVSYTHLTLPTIYSV